jgi:hypothetical protein
MLKPKRKSQKLNSNRKAARAHAKHTQFAAQAQDQQNIFPFTTARTNKQLLRMANRRPQKQNPNQKKLLREPESKQKTNRGRAKKIPCHAQTNTHESQTKGCASPNNSEQNN